MRSSTSIRTQLVGLVLAVTLPLTAMGAYVVWSEARLSRELADSAVLEHAQATAESVGQFLSSAEQTLRGMASRPLIRSMEADGCQTFLSEANQVLAQYKNLFLVRPDGALVCSALPPPPGVISGAGAVWYEQAVEREGFSVARPLFGRISSTWIIVLSHPVRDPDGSLLGYLGASVELETLRQILLAALPEAGGVITLAHVDGMVVARSDADEWTGQTLPRIDEGDRHAHTGRGIERAVGLDGIDRVWGYRTVPDSDWIVYAGIPTAAVYAGTRAEALGTGLGVLLLVALLTVLAGGLYRQVTGALRGLVEGVESAAEGGKSSISTDGPPEVVAVAQAFNRTLAARARAEAGLRRSTERHQSILRHAVFGIYVSTPEGRLLEANPALAEMLGYEDPEELLAVPMQRFYRSADERERLVRRAVEGQSANVVEVEWVRKDGRPLHARLYVSTITDLDGEVAFEVIAEDLTDRKELEEQLRQAQKLEAVGRLAGGVAHDFNNRLTVIQGQAGILMADLPDEDPLMENVEAILESARKASALTAQLLAFGRKQVARPRLLDLNDVVANIGKVLPRLMGEDIVTRLELSDEPVRIMADPGQIEQILLNLCTNARDAMPGGGDLTIATEARIRASDERVPAGLDAGAWAVLSVIDDGEGMDAAVRMRLFEPFFTTKEEGKGTGLGLSTVYGLVKQAGGEVEVVSTPGQGAAFHIWLPLARGHETQVVATEVLEAPSDQKALVVDDDPTARRFVARTLARAGYAVLESDDGAAALEIARRGTRPVDLLVTDVVMPNMRGDELARRLASRNPSLRVLFISGYVEEASTAGGQPRRAFLAKPFTPDELLEAIGTLMNAEPAPR